MIRELVLVAADLRATPWFASGTPPRPPLPPHIAVHQLTEINDANRFTTGPVSIDTARTRLAADDRCVIAEDSKTGALIAQLWLSRTGRALEWIGCLVNPPDGHVLLYNAWVDTAFRGPGVHWALAAEACHTVAAGGMTRIYAGVERSEFAPFARKYADMGLAVIVPTASLWTWRIGGFTPRLMLPPPASLVRLSREIGATFAGPSCT